VSGLRSRLAHPLPPAAGADRLVTAGPGGTRAPVPRMGAPRAGAAVPAATPGADSPTIGPTCGSVVPMGADRLGAPALAAVPLPNSAPAPEASAGAPTIIAANSQGKRPSVVWAGTRLSSVCTGFPR